MQLAIKDSVNTGHDVARNAVQFLRLGCLL
jgi:hypothetical protein